MINEVIQKNKDHILYSPTLIGQVLWKLKKPVTWNKQKSIPVKSSTRKKKEKSIWKKVDIVSNLEPKFLRMVIDRIIFFNNNLVLV